MVVVMKNKKNIIIASFCSVVAAAAVVGVFAGLSNGFKKDFSEWFETRNNLRVLNLYSPIDQVIALGDGTIVDYLNDSELRGSNAGTIVSTANYVNFVYQWYGLKIGYTEVGGSFSVNLIDDFTFDRCLIRGRNYYDVSYIDEENGIDRPLYNTDGTMIVQKYTSDCASLSINNSDAQAFPTNEEKLKEYPIEVDLTFTFDSPQKTLDVTSLNGRSILYSIELWTS